MTGAMAQTKLNIVLCGFMGCGKSTVGKKLSQMTQMEFVDMDGYIEKRAGMKIPDIFEKHGEDFFRDLEHEAAVELSQRGGYVVATGGGALTFQRNVDAFKEGGVIVLLDTPLRVLQLRLKNDRTASAPAAGPFPVYPRASPKADAPLSKGRRCSNSHERLT